MRNNPVNLTDPSGYNWLEKAADMVVGAALMIKGVSFVIAPEPTGLTKFVGSVLISTGGGLLSGDMQLFNKDENGNRYFAIQGQIPTNWGQGTDSLTSHQSKMIASQTSDEAFYNHDITYNYKYMNAGASESFSYNGDSSGSVALYGDGWNSNGDFSIYGAEDKLVITKTFQHGTIPALNNYSPVLREAYAIDLIERSDVGLEDGLTMFFPVGRVAGGLRILNSGKYSSAVIKKSLKDTGFHNFHPALDGFMKYGQKSWPIQGDGKSRMMIRLEGYMRGNQNWYKGNFEWMIDADSTISHRVFIPY